MPDYTFYQEGFLGEDIPEADFPRYAARAERLLAGYRSRYRARPRPGVPDAEDNAICAIADAMYEFDTEDEARGLVSVSAGSVSETYAPPEALSPATLDMRELFFRRQARDFMIFERGVRHG